MHFALCPHCQTTAFSVRGFTTSWVCPHCGKDVHPEKPQTEKDRLIRSMNTGKHSPFNTQE